MSPAVTEHRKFPDDLVKMSLEASLDMTTCETAEPSWRL